MLAYHHMGPAHHGVGQGVVAVERDGSMGGGAGFAGGGRQIGPEAQQDGQIDGVGETRMCRREVGV